MAQKKEINSDGRWRSLAVQSLFLADGATPNSIAIFGKFAPQFAPGRATAGGAAILKLNAAIFEANVTRFTGKNLPKLSN